MFTKNLKYIRKVHMHAYTRIINDSINKNR